MRHRIIIDTFCDVYDLLEPHTIGEFYDLKTHRRVPDAIYLIGREQMRLNADLIKSWVDDGTPVVFSVPKEGSATMLQHIQLYNIEELVLAKKILLISGGDMSAEWPCLSFDSFLPQVLDYPDNQRALYRSNEIFDRKNKPYKFLFLNGRNRPHRKFLLDRWAKSDLLGKSIWTCLEGEKITYLPAKYEIDRFRPRIDSIKSGSLVKYDLFGKEWGDVLINPDLYIDTYFSVVTETVHDYPYSFRTEKIWKPIVIGHPWIAVANRGFYRDLRNLGFKTFQGIIDESFDMIDDNHQRLERVASIVEDLAEQDLDAFLTETQKICKYNQEHYSSMRQKVRHGFPDLFFQFLRDHQWMI